MSEELKPCPFCGNTHIVLMSNGIGDVFAICEEETEGDMSCGAQSSPVRCETEAHAIRRWNRRDGDGVRATPLEALRPFANEANAWEEMGDTRPIATDTNLAVGDLRRAREAFSGGGESGDDPAEEEIADVGRLKLAKGPPDLPTYEQQLEQLFIDCAQIIDAVKTEWVAAGTWSDWDQRVRDRITQRLTLLKDYPAVLSTGDGERVREINPVRDDLAHTLAKNDENIPSGIPDWKSIYEVSCHQEDRDNELVAVTRETLRLASHALRKQNEDDYYHNYGAAEQEITAALSLPRGDEITESLAIVSDLHKYSLVIDSVIRHGPDTRDAEKYTAIGDILKRTSALKAPHAKS